MAMSFSISIFFVYKQKELYNNFRMENDIYNKSNLICIILLKQLCTMNKIEQK